MDGYYGYQSVTEYASRISVPAPRRMIHSFWISGSNTRRTYGMR
jgi:hypothetical protein